MYRIGLVLLALSLLTVAPTHVLVGGCGGGRMGRMEAMTGSTNDATGGGVGVSAIVQRHGRKERDNPLHVAPTGAITACCGAG